MNRDKTRHSRKYHSKVVTRQPGRKVTMSDLIKRLRESTKKRAESGQEVYDPTARKSWPMLMELMTTVQVEGRDRVPTSLRISAGKEGGWLMILTDKDSRQVLFHATDTLLEGLDQIEGLLQEGTADWRPERQWTPKKGK